jgi:hydrogenase-4 transcriptional activator
LLVEYPWPGNVRELSAVIERAAILGNGKRLEIARALGTANRMNLPASPPRTEPLPLPAIPPMTLDQAMARHIRETLARSGGRIEGLDGAAARLAINPHTLRSRMRKLGIDWSQYRARSPA